MNEEIHGLKKFVWSKANRELVSDASSLGIGPADRWPDTLRIKSHHTGVVEQFNWVRALVGPEGEFFGAAYASANMRLGIIATVFNT